MKLTATALKYEHEGEDGYRFTVDASRDSEAGWSAYLSLSSYGWKTPEEAIKRLRNAAEAFLRALKEMET